MSLQTPSGSPAMQWGVYVYPVSTVYASHAFHAHPIVVSSLAVRLMTRSPMLYQMQSTLYQSLRLTLSRGLTQAERCRCMSLKILHTGQVASSRCSSGHSCLCDGQEHYLNGPYADGTIYQL